MSQLAQIKLVPSTSLVFDREGCRAGRTSLLKHAVGAEADAGRLELMLAVAFRQRVPRAAFRQFLAAAESSKHGDQAIANLRLAFSRLSQIPEAHDLHERIEKVELLLCSGMEPEEVLAAIDFDREAPDFWKYDPAQPRVPAGSGPTSGRWTNGGNTGATSTAAAIALRAAPVLDVSFGPLALRVATIFAAGAGFGTAFGLLIVPSPNSVSTSGPMPGDAGQTYSYDQPTGVLRVLDAEGQILAAGVKDPSGVFTDADTGVPFARALDGTIVFGSAAIAASANVSDDAHAVPGAAAQADADNDEPRLCPDPGPDQPGSAGASDRAKAYQEQISRMINPQRPLPFGIVPALVNAATGKLVHYDECDERTGDMIEAKAPGFNGLLSFPSGVESVEEKWLKQSSSETQAAGSREVVWYFAEEKAADHARQLFAKKKEGRERIIVRVQPADKL